MEIADELARTLPQQDTALTIGVFDGVHLGHQQLLQQVREVARREGARERAVAEERSPGKPTRDLLREAYGSVRVGHSQL